MATQATRGVGNKIYVSDGVGGFDLIAEVLNLKPFALTAGTIDVTNQDSLAKEFISDLSDFGIASFEMNFLPHSIQQRQLITDLQSNTARDYRVIFNNTAGTVADFSAFPTDFSPDASIGSQLKASVSLKITGPVTFDAS